MLKILTATMAIWYAGVLCAAQTYLVETQIAINGENVAAPSVEVADGAAARITEDQLYDLEFVITKQDDVSVKIDSTLVSNDRVTEPVLIVKLGHEAVIEVDGTRFAIVISRVGG